MFALIWIGWINGTLYLELHGREDGRTRTVVFVQMGVLVPAGGVHGRGGRQQWTWLRAHVRHVPGAADVVVVRGAPRGSTRPPRVPGPDEALRHGHRRVGGGRVRQCIPSRRPATRRVGRASSVGWVVGLVSLGHPAVGLSRGLRPTESLVERFGLFTIIVLGEVVFGVVDGLSARRARPQDDQHRDDRARDRVRLLVDLLRPRRSSTTASRRRRAGDLAAEPPPDHNVDHGSRRGHGQPDRPRPRHPHASEHGMAAGRRRGRGPARAGGHRHRRSTMPSGSPSSIDR